MTFPPLPEIPELHEDKMPTHEQFVVLRQTLERLRQELDQLTGLNEVEVTNASQKPCLFEAPPTGFESRSALPMVRTIIEPVPPKPDAILERATLEELNMALGLAFAQIANKRVW
jgi:hypothetical protein